MTTPFQFVQAVKTGSWARLALTGVSGSGKTFSALTLARALGDNPGLIDTDRHRARKYADLFTFRHLPMATFDPEDLTRATIAAAEQGINPLIIDTLSPFWGGEDGMLDKVGAAASSFEGWKRMRPVERQMMDAVLGYPGHLIVTMRVKTEYVVELNTAGKMAPRKIGLKPEQRDNIESEFDVILDMDNAVARISKSICPELRDKTFDKPTEEVGEIVLRWLERDAVGQPLNPITVRDWALEDGRTPPELGAKFRELDAVGQASAVVYGPDGQLTSLEALLRERAAFLRRTTAATLSHAVADAAA
jgi:hypothetical protein